jgi:hypothetical protein
MRFVNCNNIGFPLERQNMRGILGRLIRSWASFVKMEFRPISFREQAVFSLGKAWI